jgi:hypothetical protein
VVEKDLHEIGIVAAHLRVQRRFDQARSDGVDAHAMLAEFGGERAGKAQHAVLRGRVGRRVRRAHMHERLDRGDVDDPPLARAQGL